jgi:WXG100 family type VII secretion target
MSTEYDSVKIRALAKKLAQTASAVSDVNSSTLKGVLKEMPDNFQGSAAEALQESVNELMTDVSAIGTQLSAVSQALYNLAAKVEYADQQAKKLIMTK